MSLQDLHTLGQSVWLDCIRRHLLQSGEFIPVDRERLGPPTGRALRVHLGPDVDAGLDWLTSAVREVLR